GRLPLRQGRGGAGRRQGENAGARRIVAGDVAHRRAIVDEGQHVLAAVEATGDRDRGRGKRGVVHIGNVTLASTATAICSVAAVVPPEAATAGRSLMLATAAVAALVMDSAVPWPST